MRHRWVLLLALLLVLFGWAWLAKEAGARSTRHATTDPVALAIHLGEEYWGVAPCEGRVWADASAVEPAGAEGSPGEPPLIPAYTTMWATVGSCSFTVNARYWPTWRADDARFQLFCDQVTHELGHLAPLDHTDQEVTDPASIEYALIEDGSPNYDAVPQCEGQILWFGRLRFTG